MHQCFRVRVPRRKAVSFSSNGNWPASFWDLDQKHGKEHCSSPWCVLENLIPQKAALVFFWTSSQTLPYRKPARANAETSTTLISLSQSSMAIETRQRDQWHTAHTEAKQRCWTQKRKKQTFCVHLPKNIKISKNFWVPRFYGSPPPF